MRFYDIIGSEEFKKSLASSIDNGRIPHAQIFEGRHGYQSLSYALAYATYLNCTSPTGGDACGKCNSCLKNSVLQHPDVYFIYPVGVPMGKKGKKEDYISADFIELWRKQILESLPLGCFSENEWYTVSGIGGEKGNSQGSIGRSEADYIMEQMSYSPIDGGFRVFVIWLPERMNNSAANALLKLFEEPSDKTVFLFVSEQPSQVLPTILSRAQSITIPAVSGEALYAFIREKFQLEEMAARAIVAAANGDISEAVRMLTSHETDNAELELFVSLTRRCYAANIDAILEWVEEFITLNKEQQKKFFREAADVLRSSFMMNIGVGELSYCYGAEMDFVKNFHKVIGVRNIEPVIGEFERAFKELSANGNARIVVTHFALTLISKLKIK
ncbi:MAG: DNA polymerase III subunit delta [Rikenellaceae bacterium]